MFDQLLWGASALGRPGKALTFSFTPSELLIKTIPIQVRLGKSFRTSEGTPRRVEDWYKQKTQSFPFLGLSFPSYKVVLGSDPRGGGGGAASQ